MNNLINKLRDNLVNDGTIIRTKSWQGTKQPPAMIELLHISEKVQMLEDPKELSDALRASQPWANIHFKERVQGYATNPDPSHSMWASTTKDYMSSEDKFSHTYSERMWPTKLMPKGIRYDTADLNTLIKLLKDEPDTRQAYLPMFFPEDLTAATLNERVPCSLGWHFIIRDNKLDVMYTMRSCDAMRHLQNDIYFANKLAIWLNDKLGGIYKMGILHFVVTSLHCFEQDIKIYKKGLIK